MIAALELQTWLTGLAPLERVALIIVAAVVAHLAVRLVRRGSLYFLTAATSQPPAKLRTIVSLLDSTLVFVLYFVVVGLLLDELGIELQTYFASASIIGIAVAFGAQGLVQDVVTGLTLVFADIVDVGDMVEVSGQVGLVERVGMRFVVVRNYLDAEVVIPNRSINNVLKYERGYVRALLDVRLPSDEAQHAAAEERVRGAVEATAERFPGIFRREASFDGRRRTADGASLLRVKLRIWPGQGGPIENVARREIVESLRALDAGYQDWMVNVTYESDRKVVARKRPSEQPAKLLT